MTPSDGDPPEAGRPDLFGGPGPGRILRLTLLALVVLAASVRTYLSCATAPSHPVLDPGNILRGASLAPNQYRVLAPILWAALRPALGAGEADEVLQMLAIVACNAALAWVLIRETRSFELTGVGVVAFFGATAGTMAWRNRETFLDALLTLVGFALVCRPRPRWAAFAMISVLGAIDRESWIFVLCAAAASRAAEAGGLRRLLVDPHRRRDLHGILAAAALTAAALAAVRVHYGLKPYHTALWMMDRNAPNLLPWLAPDLVIAKGVWALGAGLGCAYLLSLSGGARRHAAFVLGYAAPLFLVSFFVASWFEPRIFTALAPLLIVALLGAAARRAPRWTEGSGQAP